MIKEEAINHLKTMAKTAIDSGYDSAVVDAVSMAIKALEQEPCEDAISRRYLLDNCVMDKVIMPYVPINRIENAPPVTPQAKTGHWIPVSERLPRASEIVLLSLPEHTMVDGEECSPCVICGHYIGGKSEEWGISDGTTVGYGLVAYKHCKPIAWMPLPEPYKAESEE